MARPGVLLMNDYIMDFLACQEVFGTIQNLTERKREHERLVSDLVSAFKLSDHYSEDKKNRLADCGSFIELSEKGKVVSANFCKNRFCPICQWRLSRKTFGKVAKMQAYAEDKQPDYQYIFLTLTLENCKNLQDGLSTVLEGFRTLTNDRQFKKRQGGLIRSVEVTYNAKTKTWHPHIHVILGVPPDYFQKNYLTNWGWQDLWTRCVNTEYKPIVDVRAVKGDPLGAIAEISKYMVKPFDIQSAPGDVPRLYAELMRVMYHRRLRSFGGIYKDAAKAVGLKENMELTDLKEKNEKTRFLTYGDGEYKARLNGNDWMGVESGIIGAVALAPSMVNMMNAGVKNGTIRL